MWIMYNIQSLGIHGRFDTMQEAKARRKQVEQMTGISFDVANIEDMDIQQWQMWMKLQKEFK